MKTPVNDSISFLSQFITENRLKKMREVLEWRTRYITVVLEDIYQSHNASAVFRSCDCFGIQDVHIVENKNKFSHHPDIELGSSQWLTISRYNSVKAGNSANCINALKNRGYRIVATVPDAQYPAIDDFDIEKGKFALLFGTEATGLSQSSLSHSTEFLRIPLSGFTESLNLSVTAAVCLYTLTQKLRGSAIRWKLGEDEQHELLAGWLNREIHHK